MEEDLRALLLSNPGVAATVGQRVTWTKRPQGSPLPAIVLHLIDSVPTYTLDGDTGHRNSRVQVDCYGEMYADAKGTARAVSSALSGFKGTVGGTNFQGVFQESSRDLSEAGAIEQLPRLSLDFIAYHHPA